MQVPAAPPSESGDQVDAPAGRPSRPGKTTRKIEGKVRESAAGKSGLSRKDARKNGNFSLTENSGKQRITVTIGTACFAQHVHEGSVGARGRGRSAAKFTFQAPQV